VWLVLCHAGDVTAAWCAVALRRGGLDPVRVVLAEELVVGASLMHAISATNSKASIVLASGEVLDSARIRGVVNRLQQLPENAGLPVADRPYARAEHTAATVGWLATLPVPVLNRPVAHSLEGRWARPGEWQLAASWLGLPTSGWTSRPDPDALEGPRVLVVGDRVLWRDGDVSPIAGGGSEGALVQLATTMQAPLCELYFTVTRAGAGVYAGSILPNVSRYGAAAADALVDVLRGAAA
jgi:hypothetical protein